MARQPRKGAEATAAADKQDPKVEKAGGDVDALAPSESPLEAAEFHSERAEARLADAEASPQDLHHDESNPEQLPDSEQLTGTADPNGDQAAVDAPEVDSAGEQKGHGDTAPDAGDTSVVTAAVQQQKSVGAIARAKAPADQNKTAIAESPVSPPNGERVVTYTTPPRIAVDKPAGGEDKPGEGGTVDPVTSPFSQARGAQVGKAPATNGVTHGLETVDSGIIPDETVAETDGTFMPGGAPNETYDGTVAPDGLYVGAQLNSAPLQAPEARSLSGHGAGGNTVPIGAAGLQIGEAAISGDIIDEATGEAPDLDGLFVPLYAHGNVMVSMKRLIEKTGATSGTLLCPVGKQLTDVQAEQIKARIKG